MKQLQFYRLALVLLILLNLATISFLIFSQSGSQSKFEHKRGHRPPGDIAGELNLDDEQTAQFHEIAFAHHQRMVEISEKQARLLGPYFKTLTGENIGLSQDEVLVKVQELEREKIEVTYGHFEEIKAILREDQMADFKNFTQQIIDNVLYGRNKGPGGPPKDFPPPGV